MRFSTLKKCRTKLFFFCIAFLLGIVGCRKADSLLIDKKNGNQYKAIGTKLGFKVNNRSIGQLQSRYGTAENWFRYISVFNQKKKFSDSIHRKTAFVSRPFYRVMVYDYEGMFIATVKVYEGTYLMDALEAEGIRQLGWCDRAGAGSACVAKLINGVVNQSDQSFLSDRQMEAGFILPCVTYLESDCAIKLGQEEYLFDQEDDHPSCHTCGSGGGTGGGMSGTILTISTYDGKTYTPENYPGKAINMPWLWWVNPNLTQNSIQVYLELQEEKNEEYNDSQELCNSTMRMGNVYYGGVLEHWLIQLDYIKRYQGEREYQIPYAGVTNRYPGYVDLAKPSTKELFEIKPNNAAGQAAAILEITNYVAKANLYCPTSGGVGP